TGCQLREDTDTGERAEQPVQRRCMRLGGGCELVIVRGAAVQQVSDPQFGRDVDRLRNPVAGHRPEEDQLCSRLCTCANLCPPYPFRHFISPSFQPVRPLGLRPCLPERVSRLRKARGMSLLLAAPWPASHTQSTQLGTRWLECLS